MDCLESDWKLFRKNIVAWQEEYMSGLVEQYIQLLNGPEDAPNKFWKLEKRIRKDKKNPGVIIEMTRSMMLANIISLIHNEVITVDDLQEFSDDLKNKVSYILKVVNEND